MECVLYLFTEVAAPASVYPIGIRNQKRSQMKLFAGYGFHRNALDTASKKGVKNAKLLSRQPRHIELSEIKVWSLLKGILWHFSPYFSVVWAVRS
jgi:hypothetical protein